jgi:hypothetical protein
VDPVDLGQLGRVLGSDKLTPQITVLMAVYDAPLEMLEQALDSILHQTFADFEFLIIDDGSNDPKVRSRLDRRARYDARIRIAREPHRGLTASLNRGLQLARGSWIARQDADDWSEPARLERQMEYLLAHPETTVLGTDAWTHQQDGLPLWQLHLPLERAAILARLRKGNPFVHGSVMFPRAAALAAGGYREEFRCSQDYDFLWRLAEQGGAANLAEPLYHYRYTRASVSAGRAAEQARAHRAIQRLGTARARGEPEDVAGELARPHNTPGSDASLKQADHLMLAGEYRQACAAYGKLLGARPRNFRAWAKLARLGVFWAFPRLRQACFR